MHEKVRRPLHRRMTKLSLTSLHLLTRGSHKLKYEPCERWFLCVVLSSVMYIQQQQNPIILYSNTWQDFYLRFLFSFVPIIMNQQNGHTHTHFGNSFFCCGHQHHRSPQDVHWFPVYWAWLHAQTIQVRRYRLLTISHTIVTSRCTPRSVTWYGE